MTDYVYGGGTITRKELAYEELEKVLLDKKIWERELKKRGKELIPERPLPIVTEYKAASPQLKGVVTKIFKTKRLSHSQQKRLAKMFLPTSKVS